MLVIITINQHVKEIIHANIQELPVLKSLQDVQPLLLKHLVKLTPHAIGTLVHLNLLDVQQNLVLAILIVLLPLVFSLPMYAVLLCQLLNHLQDVLVI